MKLVLKKVRRLRGGAALTAAGLVTGMLLITPAGAHVTNKLTHLFGHLDKRYVQLVEAERNGDPPPITTATDRRVSSIEIEAAESGILLVQGSMIANNDSSGSNDDHVMVRVSLDGGPLLQTASTSLGPEVVGGQFDREEVQTLSYVHAFPVQQGTHTVEQYVTPGGTGIDVNIEQENLVVTFVPDGTIDIEDITSA